MENFRGSLDEGGYIIPEWSRTGWPGGEHCTAEMRREGPRERPRELCTRSLFMWPNWLSMETSRADRRTERRIDGWTDREVPKGRRPRKCFVTVLIKYLWVVPRSRATTGINHRSQPLYPIHRKPCVRGFVLGLAARRPKLPEIRRALFEIWTI